MEIQVFEMAIGAARLLLNPFAVAVPLLAVLALVTGLAGRMAVFVEDLRHSTAQPTIIEE